MRLSALHHFRGQTTFNRPRFDAGILAGDVTGDGVADFEIQIAGVRGFDATALVA